MFGDSGLAALYVDVGLRSWLLAISCCVEALLTSAGELLTTLPRDVDLRESILLREFERGRAHLLFVLSMRLDFWRSLP